VRYLGTDELSRLLVFLKDIPYDIPTGNWESSVRVSTDRYLLINAMDPNRIKN
jgi:hypothetical protein